jgi:hypothetical protein
MSPPSRRTRSKAFGSTTIRSRSIGHGETERWTLAFDDDNVDIKFVSTDGDEADLHGEAAN